MIKIVVSTIRKVVHLNPLRGSAISNKVALINVWHYTKHS